jgi:iron complex outermembrane recepter protein
VVVTGSRIAIPNETSISPVTFVSAADIERTGVTRVEDLLNQLPQVFADQGSTVSNGSSGTATVDSAHGQCLGHQHHSGRDAR